MTIGRKQLHFEISINGESYIYCYIKKNACSSWKKLFTSESPFREKFSRGEKPIRFMDKYHRVKSIEKIKQVNNRVVVVRDPVDRALSGFFNRVVVYLDAPSELNKEIEEACGKSIFDTTFFDFLKFYVMSKPDSDVDDHFRTQRSHMLNVDYSHVWDLKNLYKSAAFEFGEDVANKYFYRKVNSTSNASTTTSFSDVSKLGDLYDLYLKEGRLPDRKSFLSEAALCMLKERYGEDYSMLLSHRGGVRS